MTRFILVYLIIISAFCFAGRAYAGSVFSNDWGRVDLSRVLTFEEYLKSGSDERRIAGEERVKSATPSAAFINGIKGIDEPLTFLIIGMTYCPDCKAVYPSVEAMPPANPLIRTKYITRNSEPDAREFMRARTGRTNMPAIFVVKPDGTVLSGAYVETPRKVTELLEAAKTENERGIVWDAFHSGAYDAEIERDLLSLAENAALESKK